MQTFDEGGTDLTHGGVLLPVVSYSIGGCLYFGFRFLDNYSAGKTSEAPPSDEALYRLQKDVPYGDRFYSRAETLSFSLYNEITPPDGDAERLALSHALPEGADAVTLGSPLVSLGAHPLIWHKDSADAGNVSYQLHFVSSDGFIVGSALARGVPLAASAAGAVGARMYFFDRRINELTGTSDERLAIASLPLSYVASDPAAVVRVGTPPASFKSWAILRDGEFLLGKNTSEDPGAIYINLRRKR